MEGFWSFYVIFNPLKADLNCKNQIFLAEFVQDYDEPDFMNYAFSDKFFIYTIKKLNHQNDHIWAAEIREIKDGEHSVSN